MIRFLKTPLFFCLVVLLLATIITYSNHFSNAFHFDDSHSVESNPNIRDIKNIPVFFKDGSTSSILPQNQSYRPIVTTSLAIDYWLGGGYNLFYFHLSSFILFLLQGLFMFMLYNKVFYISAAANKSMAYVAVIAAALYMLHPAIAETVNYVIARSDLQSTFCVLLALVLYIYSPFCKRTFLYLLPIGIGSLAKPPAVMFAPLLLFYILFFEQNLSLADIFKNPHRKQAIQLLLKTLPAFIFCGIMYQVIAKLTPASWQAGGTSPMLYLITQPFVIMHYFGTLFLPVGLSADSDWGLLPGIADIRFFIGFAFVLLLLAIAFYTSKHPQTRPISYGILWFFIALVPTSSIIPLAEVLNDHRMYFPFVGLVMSVVWATSLLLKEYMQVFTAIPMYRAVGLVVLGCILSGFAYGTYRRNEVWHTEESLWRDVTIKSPNNGRGLMNYGLTQMNKGNYAEAGDYFNRALLLMPNYFSLDINLGVLYNAKGDKAAAEPYFLKAIKDGPDYPDSYFFYARFLAQANRNAEAIPQALKAIELSPSHYDARILLMSIYEATGDWDKLKALAQSTLAIVPGNPAVLQYLASAQSRKGKLQVDAENVKNKPTADKYLNLSLMYYQAGKYQECVDAAAEAVKLKPGYAAAYNNMGSAYNALQQYAKAAEALKKAVALDPGSQLAKNNLAAAQAGLDPKKNMPQAGVQNLTAEQYINMSLNYFNQGQYQLCVDACYKALALKPGYDLAYNNICASYNKLGQWDQAVKAGEEGLKLNPQNQLMKNNLAESYKRGSK